MANGKITGYPATIRNLSGIYAYLRRNACNCKKLKVDFSESELSLILDRGTGIRGYEEGSAEPDENLFKVEYFGIRNNAIQTFSSSRVRNYEIARRFQNRVNKSVKAGQEYRKRWHEQIVLVETNVIMPDVKDFFKFLIEAFKEKLRTS